MTIGLACTNCKQKTFSVLVKGRMLNSRYKKKCSSCGFSFEISFLIRISVLMLVTILSPMLFIIFFGVNGFLFSIGATLISTLLVVLCLAYVSPLKYLDR